MAVTSFQDLPLSDRGREWDGSAAEKRVRSWAGAEVLAQVRLAPVHRHEGADLLRPGGHQGRGHMGADEHARILPPDA